MKTSDPSSLLPTLPHGSEVLLIRLRVLGDVVMLTPVLAALHAWRPDLRLCVLVEPALAAVLEGNPAVSEVLLHRDFASSALLLRRRRFPVVYNQHGGPTSAFLTALSGAPARVCWSYCQFARFYNIRVPHPSAIFPDRKPHTVEHRVSQFYFTGLPRGPLPPAQVFPQADAAAAVQEKLGERGVGPSQGYVVMHPGATLFTKRWAVENYAQIARWLREAYGLMPVVTLGPGDTQIAVAVRKHLSGSGVVLESLSLRELIALMAGARMFVGNDTGPAHLAAAAGRPCVVIFGPTDSLTWRPWHVVHQVVQNDFPCNPCRADRCYAFDQPQCILSVTPEQVQHACRALLDAGR